MQTAKEKKKICKAKTKFKFKIFFNSKNFRNLNGILFVIFTQKSENDDLKEGSDPFLKTFV